MHLIVSNKQTFGENAAGKEQLNNDDLHHQQQADTGGKYTQFKDDSIVPHQHKSALITTN